MSINELVIHYSPKWSVTEWAVVVVFAVLFLGGLLKYRPFHITRQQALAIWSLVMYLIFIYCGAVFTRKNYSTSRFMLEPFWSYRWGIRKYGLSIVQEVILNVFMFLPVGVLLPVIFSNNKMESERRRFALVMLVGLGCSLAVELLQVVLRCGLCEFDDLFHNVLGVAIGYRIFKWNSRRMVRDNPGAGMSR